MSNESWKKIHSALESYAALASHMNDEVCQSYYGEWQRALEAVEIAEEEENRIANLEAATALQAERVRELEYSSDKRGVMLMMIREILNVLPDDCLGTGSMRDCAPYPIKAEVIDGIGKALSATAREG
jgi:hypothetical protein